MSYQDRIVIHPEIRFGKPIVKNTRITVYDVLGWLASGMSFSDIIADFPEITEADIRACLAYAADRVHKLHIAAWVYFLIKTFPSEFIEKIKSFFPGATQVRLVGLEDKKDIEIWQYAKEQGYYIVTFDSDFFDLSIVKGIPPKIIWLRAGNLGTDRIGKTIVENRGLIRDFMEDARYREIACLEL